ncbi:hypothetical protein GYMLUDRAFT_61199 [Collybiopsis luxurians FD-317 M1]|uniref:Protein transport protein sec16 n=1 Tax=Collybiopsis luxurians FD-317 M1 TaxID=944289 RepID=A0A0D0C5L0_9AGAR|nr:hypothetical protein GYMLUDRAFT_61199 [Collybiopsis luxurians FD-317 M1]
MSGLETAASLFGTDDSTSDPFASLGSDSQPTAAGVHNANDDLFAVNDPSSAPDFFSASQSYPEQAIQPEAALQSQEPHSSWPETNSYDLGPQNVQSTSVHNHQGQQPEQTYGDQWQNYSQQANFASTHANGTTQAHQPFNAYTSSQYTNTPQTMPPQSYGAASTYSQSAYNPYAPASSYSSASSQSAYDPYAPPVQSQKTTPPLASPQTSHGSYAPPSQSNYGVPSYAVPAQQNSYGSQKTASSVGAVVPPTPKAPLNRPKVLNAYDPPFPTTTTRRQARNATSPPSFNNYTSISPPPPLPPTHSIILPPPNVAHAPPLATRPPSVPVSNYSGLPSTNTPASNLGRTESSIAGGPPHTSEIDGVSAYSLPPRSNSYGPSVSVQDHTLSNQTGGIAYNTTHGPHPLPLENVGLESSQGSFSEFSEPETSPTLRSRASADFVSGDQLGTFVDSGEEVPRGITNQPNASVNFGADNQSGLLGDSSLSFSTSSRQSSPEVPQSLPQLSGIHSPPLGGPPKRASSAAAIRAPPRTQSPLSRGPELSRPRSSNSGLRSVYSPGSNSQHFNSLDMYSPKVGQIPEETSSYLPSSMAPSDSYAPRNQTLSPQVGGASSAGVSSPYDPYAPPTHQQVPKAPSSPPQPYGHSRPHISGSAPAAPPRNRSMSNGSMLSTLSEDPSNHNRFQSNESDYGAYSSRYNYPENEKLSVDSGPPSSTLGPAQEIKAPTYTPYAPSPSLLGTNDPLGRAGARVPVFSFGFGGKFVTCFHGADKMNTGFDVALASRNSTGVEIRTLNKLIPSSSLNISSATFPGPLFSDPGSPTAGIVRPGAAAQTKTKKARVIKYLEDRAEELSQGLGYMHSGEEDQGRTESKIILFKILKILVENDGKLSGTPSIDAAVRAALVPQAVTDTSASESSGFTSVADLQGSDSAFLGLSGSANSNETPIAVTTLRPSALNKIEGFLLRGERRQAYHYALDQKLWSHAMIIASGIDKEAWQEVVNEFLKTELASPSTVSASSMGNPNGREGLRVVYSLMSGQGAKSVHQLVPKTSLSNPAAVLLAPMTVAATPISPNFSVPAPAANIPAESLSKWAEIVAMMLSGSVSSETSATLTALGDQLAGNGWTEAAHVCYLLSPQTSTVAGSQHPSARIVLLGSRNPHSFSNFMSDPDPIILSEIHEFALSLTPVPKGQEPFGGLPHLQGYRFIRAVCLAELGDVSNANRYCEAINVSMTRPSSYYTPVMLEMLKGLSDRISGVTQTDKAGSWMSGKLAKPSLDGFGGWLEGRFTKLVTGDIESPTRAEHKHDKNEERGFVGPFSHYSTISSTTTSTSPSPQNSVVNLNAYAAAPARTGSALSINSNVQTEQASSAMDQARQRYAPPSTKATSATASTTTFAQAQSRSFGPSLSPNDTLTPRPSSEDDEGQEVSWWGSSSAVTPTAATFVQLSGNALSPSSDGFVSLMDSQNYAVASTSHTTSNARMNHDVEDEEDLGFGNSKPKFKTENNGPDAQKEEPKAEPKAEPSRPGIKPVAAASSSSGSWLGRWWKRDSTPGPIKASLGDNNSFYFDPELKKWVNKKAGSEEAAKPATPPPPPSRAQTASPAGAGRPPSVGPPSAGLRPPSAGPPPPRATSAMDNSSKPPIRIRSNLVPSDESGVGSAPSTPTGSRLAPPAPPPGRPRSQASKRNVRSRYVDVFQQEGSS